MRIIYPYTLSPILRAFAIMIAFLYVNNITAQTWSGSGTNNNWTTGANWTGGVAAGNNSNATFAGTTRLTPNFNSTDYVTLNSLTFASGAGAFNISGGTLGIGSSGVTNSSSNLQTFSGLLEARGNQTWNTGSAGIRVTGNLAGWGTLTKTGSGTLNLQGNVTPVLAINAGTLLLSGSGSRSVASNNTIASGATLNIQDGITVTGGSFTVGGTGVSNGGVIRNVSGNNTLSTAITLSSNSSFVSNAGQLTLGEAVSMGSNNLTLDGAGAFVMSKDLSGSGTLTKLGAGAVQFLGNVTSGAFSSTGSGNVSVSGNINAAGNISFTGAGVYSVTGATTASTGNITITPGSASSFTGKVESTNGSVSVTSSTGSTTFGGNVLGKTGITFSGAGNTTVGGYLSTSNGSIAISGNGNFTATNGVNSAQNGIAISGSGTRNFGAAVSTAGALTSSGPGNVSFAGQVTATGGITLSGTGNNTFSGSTQIGTGSVLNVNNSGTNVFTGQVNVGTINITSGTNTFGAIQNLTGGLNVSGNASVNFNGDIAASNAGININTSGNIVFNGKINSGTLTLNKGHVTVTGSGDNDLPAAIVNGGTLVLDQTGGRAVIHDITVNNGGTVIFEGDNQIPSGGTNLTLNAGGTLYLGNTTQTIQTLNITGNSVIDFGSGGSQLNVGSGGINIANNITITIVNWSGAAGDIFAGANPGTPVVNVQYADSSGTIYASGTWGSGYVTPGAPVPEPATYGFIMLGAGIVLVCCRRPSRPSATQA